MGAIHPSVILSRKGIARYGGISHWAAKDRGQKINANFLDVRAENHGRPRQIVRFPVAPVVGRNFSTPGHPGVRVRNVRGKSGPKSLCLPLGDKKITYLIFTPDELF